MGMCFSLLYLIKLFKMTAELYKGVSIDGYAPEQYVGAVHYQPTTSHKAGHRSNLASLRFRVNAATERRKHTKVDFVWITRRFRTIAAFSDQLGALGRQRIHVHVTGGKTQQKNMRYSSN